jgi:hypothetical protein
MGTYTTSDGCTREERTCDYCGKSETEVGEVSVHSGALECWPCWNWRKLDGPAARHWGPIFKQFLSNVDYHDATKFFPDTLGISTEEFRTLIELVTKAHINCDHAIALHEH